MLFNCLRAVPAGIEINTGVLKNRVIHGLTAEGGSEINFFALIRNFCSTENRFRAVGEQIFGKFHHSVVIGVSLIKLHACIFRIMRRIHALVAELVTYLINLFQTADDAHFERKLGCNAHKNVQVKCIIMAYEGTRIRTACNGIDNRGLNFQKSALIQVSANFGNNSAALNESCANLGVHDKVNIAHAIAQISITKAMEFFRKRP